MSLFYVFLLAIGTMLFLMFKVAERSYSFLDDIDIEDIEDVENIEDIEEIVFPQDIIEPEEIEEIDSHSCFALDQSELIKVKKLSYVNPDRGVGLREKAWCLIVDDDEVTQIKVCPYCGKEL